MSIDLSVPLTLMPPSSDGESKVEWYWPVPMSADYTEDVDSADTQSTGPGDSARSAAHHTNGTPPPLTNDDEDGSETESDDSSLSDISILETGVATTVKQPSGTHKSSMTGHDDSESDEMTMMLDNPDSDQEFLSEIDLSSRMSFSLPDTGATLWERPIWPAATRALSVIESVETPPRTPEATSYQDDTSFLPLHIAYNSSEPVTNFSRDHQSVPTFYPTTPTTSNFAEMMSRAHMDNDDRTTAEGEWAAFDFGFSDPGKDDFSNIDACITGATHSVPPTARMSRTGFRSFYSHARQKANKLFTSLFHSAPPATTHPLIQNTALRSSVRQETSISPASATLLPASFLNETEDVDSQRTPSPSVFVDAVTATAITTSARSQLNLDDNAITTFTSEPTQVTSEFLTTNDNDEVRGGRATKSCSAFMAPTSYLDRSTPGTISTPTSLSQRHGDTVGHDWFGSDGTLTETAMSAISQIVHDRRPGDVEWRGWTMSIVRGHENDYGDDEWFTDGSNLATVDCFRPGLVEALSTALEDETNWNIPVSADGSYLAEVSEGDRRARSGFDRLSV